MSDQSVLPTSVLPGWFEYPQSFLRVVECGLTRFDPWDISTGQLLQQYSSGLHGRYPNLDIVPFAWRQDRDDVACWIPDGSIVTVHDYTDEHRAVRDPRFPDFESWFRDAIDEFLEFG